MRTTLARFALGLSLFASAPLAAQTSADSAGIRATALDYAEGWYMNQPERMERALHPDLAKRIVSRDAEGKDVVRNMDKATLVGAVKSNAGRNAPGAALQRDVQILSIYANAAVVKLEMDGWVDFMQMGRVDGRWLIVNVLWANKPRPPRQ
jgi:Putative lumazine-binding